jgi:hypothetical protein
MMILTVVLLGDSIVWTSNQGQDEQTEYVEEVFKIEQIKTLAGKYCLCVTGNSILELQGIYSSKQNDKNETDYHLVIQKLFPYVTICARFSPSQKEMVGFFDRKALIVTQFITIN